MAEYIDLDVAVKAFNNFDAGRADDPPCTLLKPEEFAEYLYELPTADVAPVIHARWISDGLKGYWCYCSSCKKTTSFFIISDYCPNCGAKMDGGKERWQSISKLQRLMPQLSNV